MSRGGRFADCPIAWLFAAVLSGPLAHAGFSSHCCCYCARAARLEAPSQSQCWQRFGCPALQASPAARYTPGLS